MSYAEISIPSVCDAIKTVAYSPCPSNARLHKKPHQITLLYTRATGTDRFDDRRIGGEVHVAERDRVSLGHLHLEVTHLRTRIHSLETTRGTTGQLVVLLSRLKRSVASR